MIAKSTEEFYKGALFNGALFKGELFNGALFKGELFKGALFKGALFKGALFKGALFKDELFIVSLNRTMNLGVSLMKSSCLNALNCQVYPLKTILMFQIILEP